MNEIQDVIDTLERLRMWEPEDPGDLEGTLARLPDVVTAAAAALAGISGTVSTTGAHQSYPDRISEAGRQVAAAAATLDGMSLTSPPARAPATPAPSPFTSPSPSRTGMPPRIAPPRPANAAAPWVPGPPPLPGLARHPSLPRRDQDQPREAPRVTMTLRERRKRTRRAIRRIRRGL
jgi:hypothetical protein